MFSKTIVFLSTIALIEASTPACPDPADSSAPAVPCVFVPDCQFPENGSLTPLATMCSNQLPDTDCEQLFPCDSAGTPSCDPAATVEDPDAESYPFVRAPACTSPGVQDIALQCAKTCALCCQSPEFNCQDDDESPVDCEENKGKCTDASWTDIMAQYCPKTCGLCDEGSCSDNYSGCDSVTSLCKNIDTVDFMKANCARTCGYCTGGGSGCTDMASNCVENANLCTNDIYRQLMQEQCCATCGGTSGGTGGSGSCLDSESECVSWVKNGFCTSDFYTPDQKKQYCAQSCNLC